MAQDPEHLILRIQILLLVYCLTGQLNCNTNYFLHEKVHVRMPESFMYDLNLIAGVNSPSTRHNIVGSGWGEYAVGNYRIASKRQLRPLILILILQTQIIIYNI